MTTSTATNGCGLQPHPLPLMGVVWGHEHQSAQCTEKLLQVVFKQAPSFAAGAQKWALVSDHICIQDSQDIHRCHVVAQTSSNWPRSLLDLDRSSLPGQTTPSPW